jgi:hypothetical protein
VSHLETFVIKLSATTAADFALAQLRLAEAIADDPTLDGRIPVGTLCDVRVHPDGVEVTCELDDDERLVAS